MAKFATGAVDTGGADGVVDTGAKFATGEFSKKFETVLMEYSGAGGKLIHKKTRSKKSRDTVPLRRLLHLGSVGSGIVLYS